jgi:3-hydroxyacyl-[acyl-carrier-protein] dehydratase
MLGPSVNHTREFTIRLSHPALPGHFPGRPIVPGVLLLGQALEAALAIPDCAAHIGAQPRLAVVKFLAAVVPGPDGARLAIGLQARGSRLRFEVRDIAQGNRLAASGEWVAAAEAAAQA